MTVHQYGYRTDQETGELQDGPCATGVNGKTCGKVTTHVCHGAWHCLECLTIHAHATRSAGGALVYAADLNRSAEEPTDTEEGT